MNVRSLLCLLAASCSVGLLSKAAYADTLTLTLNSPSPVTTQQGGTVNYVGTITATAGNSASEYLNGDSYNIGAPFTFDDSAFYINTPLFLAPGQSFTGLLFDIVVPANSAVGAYSGTFSILGGSTPGADNVTASSSFTTNVTSTAAVTPEPSTWLLLGTGLLGLGLLLRRRNPTEVGFPIA